MCLENRKNLQEDDSFGMWCKPVTAKVGCAHSCSFALVTVRAVCIPFISKKSIFMQYEERRLKYK